MKQWRWYGLVLVALLAGVVAYVVWPTTPRPCRATFEQVREGMTPDEVMATVGGPPGDYTTGPVFIVPRGLGYWFDYERWVSDDAELMVRIGEDGRVTKVLIWPAIPVNRPGFLDRLREAVGW